MISRFTSKMYETEQDHDGTYCNEVLEVVQLCNECIYLMLNKNTQIRGMLVMIGSE
jgi:hypothetical protein